MTRLQSCELELHSKRGMPMKAAFIERARRAGSPEIRRDAGSRRRIRRGRGRYMPPPASTARTGRYGKANRTSFRGFPYILGRDFSGVVAAVGDGVKDLRVGDEVFGVCDVGQEGAYAEKIAIKAAIVARKTDRLSHVDAAALALAGLTAICAVEDTLQAEGGRDDPDPGRSGRCRQLCHPAGKASRVRA